MKVVKDATIFSAVDSGGKALWECKGDTNESFAMFGQKVMENSAMFGLFHGAGAAMGKFKGIPAVANFLEKGGIPSKIVSGGLDVTGDVMAMYVLNSVEAGTLTLSPEELTKLIEQVVLFR